MDKDRSCLCQSDPTPLRGVQTLKKKILCLWAPIPVSGTRHTGERFAPPRVPCLLYAGEREKKGEEEPLVLESGPEGQMKPPDSWVTLPTLRPYRLTSLQERTGSRRDATPISTGPCVAVVSVLHEYEDTAHNPTQG